MFLSFRNNTSPNHQKVGSNGGGGSSNARKMTFYNDNNNKAKGYFAQKQHSSSASQNFSSSPKDSVTTPNHVNKNRHYQRNHQNGSPHGLTGRSPPRSPISFASPAGVSTTTPNLHFAGSKYFDAPSPNALPRPPCHWTLQNGGSTNSIELATSKRRLFTNDTDQKCSLVAAEAASKNLCSDIFSHNLKLLLNVQAWSENNRIRNHQSTNQSTPTRK